MLSLSKHESARGVRDEAGLPPPFHCCNNPGAPAGGRSGASIGEHPCMSGSPIRDPWLVSLLVARTLMAAVFLPYAAFLPVLLGGWGMSAADRGADRQRVG